MKKIILFLIAMLVVATSMATNPKITRTASIQQGYTTLAYPLSLGATDFVQADDTLDIVVTNPQKYFQHQTFTTTMTTVSGSPSVTITAYGKVNSGDSWVAIGSPSTWTSSSNNPVTITSTSAKNYNYLLLEFVASGTTQKAKVSTFAVKTANVYDATSTGATIAGAAINLNASSNYAVNINTGSSTGALSLGGGSGTVAVNSTIWDVTATGLATGLRSVTVTADGDNIILDPVTDLHAIDVQINSASKFSVDSTGVVTSAGKVNAGNGVDLGTSKALTGTTALTIGDNNQTVAINSSSWDITSAGIFSGMLRNVLTDNTGTKALAATDANCVLLCSYGSGATTVTIPDPSASTVGVIFYVVQTANQNLVVTCTTANSNGIVCDGVATTDNVTISTSSHKIGGGMIIIGLSATQWYIGGLNPASPLTPEAAD